MIYALIFAALALIYLWLEPLAKRVDPMVPLSLVKWTLLGGAGGLGLWRLAINGWSGLPLAHWTGALLPYLALVALICAALCLVFRRHLREPQFDEAGAKRIAKHLTWGLLQQALLLGFLVPEVGPWWAVSIFAAIHLPNPMLTALVTVGGLGSIWIWGWAPSVLVAGCAHATLSALVDAFLPPSITLGMAVGPGALKRLNDRLMFL